MNIDEILKDRTEIYGDYEGGCNFIIEVMTKILKRYKATHQKESMYPLYQHYIRDIVNKLSRIAVTPNHVDSWRDISGYASLIADVLEKEEQNANK